MRDLRTEKQIMQSWKGDISKPVVSICCITYNHEPYIEDALEGFLIQETDLPFEIIIRDDASPDKTAEIIREYETKYPNIIKPIYEKENGYQKGIKALPITFLNAKGEYIALCEGDDYWTEPKKLQIQIDEMKKNPQCDISFHSARALYEDKFGEVLSRHLNHNKIFNTKDFIIGGSEFCPTASLVIKKTFCINLPNFFYDAPFGDFYLQTLGAINGGGLYVDRCMSIYRKNNPNSASNQQDLGIRIKQVSKSYKALSALDQYTNYKFTRHIDHLKEIQNIRLSVKYLRHSMFNEFKNTVENIYLKNTYCTWTCKVFYLLRKYPRIFLYALKIYDRKK